MQTITQDHTHQLLFLTTISSNYIYISHELLRLDVIVGKLIFKNGKNMMLRY